MLVSRTGDDLSFDNHLRGQYQAIQSFLDISFVGEDNQPGEVQLD